jgi:hypothetical protein
MELIIARDDNNIVVRTNEKTIETYSLDAEVNFKGLMKELLGQNLKEKISITDCVAEKSEAEDNLIKIIVEIIDDYNLKVIEFMGFKSVNNILDSDMGKKII